MGFGLWQKFQAPRNPSLILERGKGGGFDSIQQKQYEIYKPTGIKYKQICLCHKHISDVAVEEYDEYNDDDDLVLITLKWETVSYSENGTLKNKSRGRPLNTTCECISSGFAEIVLSNIESKIY